MAVTVPSSAISANHQPERHQASGGSDRVVIAVSDSGHGGDRPPGRVAEVADVGIGAGSFGIEYGQGGAEGQQGSATATSIPTRPGASSWRDGSAPTTAGSAGAAEGPQQW